MAVFTDVTPQEAQSLLDTLNLGTLQLLKGATSGIENTNYFVTTDRGEYVLTLFERLSFQQLPFYLHLMDHLARRGIPVPAPQPDQRGEILLSLKGKPAAVVTRLKGANQLSPGPAECAQVGAMLARMHLAGRDYPHEQPNLRGLAWWTDTVPVVRPFLSADQATMIDDELAFQQALAQQAPYQALPRGPIHADLFRDNVLFDGDALGGVIDFYFAATDFRAYDVAITHASWTFSADGTRCDAARAKATRAAQAVRVEL